MGLIRVTTGADGTILNRGYSYWSQAYVRGDVVDTFVGHDDRQVHFYRVHEAAIEHLGNLIPVSSTGEGWYFDQGGRVLRPDGSRLLRTDPLSGVEEILFDVSGAYPGCRLWQAHSSDDGQIHSATVQRITESGPYENVATVLALPDRQIYFPAQQPLDESQITPEGSFLVIKEGEDNRIITTATEEEWLIPDADGAVGHSDCGPGILVGEDNIHGQCVKWDLATRTRQDLFPTWNLGHLAIRGSTCARSSATAISLIDLSSGAESVLLPHGLDGADYDHQCFANLSPCGSVIAFVGMVEAPRLDLYLWRL